MIDIRPLTATKPGKVARRLAGAIVAFNAGRDPERLQMKYDAMRTDAFAFLRGTAHLFYAALPHARPLEKAPPAWVCGDLHLQNFGSYKGDNRLVYFDINDFDEAGLAPCTLDLVRFAASVFVAAGTVGFSDAQARRLTRRFFDAYVAAVEAGKARWIERDSATGLIAVVLNGLRLRKRKAVLNKRTRLVNGRRHLIIDGMRVLPPSAKQRRMVARFMRRFVRAHGNSKFFRLLDVARRVAGTGSLGAERYVLLIEGKGSPDGNYLLDLKEALPSVLREHVKHKQPKWESQAHRVVTLQRRMQAVSTAFLSPVKMGGRPFVLRGLQSSEDRVDLSRANDPRDVEQLMEDMGRLVAWAQLRSTGRQGSASADALVAYWARRGRVRETIEIAKACAKRVQRDWRTYCEAYDGGLLRACPLPSRVPPVSAVGKKR